MRLQLKQGNKDGSVTVECLNSKMVNLKNVGKKNQVAEFSWGKKSKSARMNLAI